MEIEVESIGRARRGGGGEEGAREGTKSADGKKDGIENGTENVRYRDQAHLVRSLCILFYYISLPGYATPSPARSRRCENILLL